jgi:hypothetical protein
MKLAKVLFLIAAFVGSQSIVAQEPARILTNADIINMAKSGIGDQIIILSIQKAVTKFDTSPDALIQLKAAGVSDAVMSAMMTPSSNPTPNVVLQDCSPMLNKVLSAIGSEEKLASIQSSKISGSSVVRRSSGTTNLQLERVAEYAGRIHVSVQIANGTSSTLVVAPDFNYLISGKMTTAVPASTLEDILTTFKLEPIYISKHRDEYSCASDGNEQIGSVNATKLKIQGPDVTGEFYADPSTGRLLRTTYQNSTSGHVVTDYSDWKPVDEVFVPFKRHVVTDSATTDLTINEFRFNPAVDAALFHPPAGQVAASVSLKVLQSESVPYTVQTNGGISTACNISGSTNTSLTATTYGNTTYGTATSTPNLSMNCKSTDTTVRWTHVLNAMFVQASDGNAYIIACDRAWAWSKCKPLRAGDTFLAIRGDKGFVVQSYSKSKEREATYSVLQSKSLHP